MQKTFKDLLDMDMASLAGWLIKNQDNYELVEMHEEPELIQGYTAEQWQEIIDGGYLCEFSLVPFNTPGHVRLGQLEKMGDWGFLQVGHTAVDDWTYCRPAQIKGVMRPIFVEPVDPAMAGCVFFGASGAALHSGDSWGYNYVKHNNKFPKATKYIEL